MWCHFGGTTSERHEAAKGDTNKMTAGELAAEMRRAGYKVTAGEISEFAPEWHHAGWNPRGGMGRCYFFSATEASQERMKALYERVVAARKSRESTRYGWKVCFRKVGRRWQPVAHVREFEAGEKVRESYTEITQEEFAALKPFEGRDLEPHESMADFLKRETAWEAARAEREAAVPHERANHPRGRANATLCA